jgi:acyl carrier protein
MDLQTFVKNFAAQFDEIDSTIITAETEFRSIEEWSSLTALSIIAMVDQEYNVMLKGDDIRNSKTIGDIYKIVVSKIKA